MKLLLLNKRNKENIRNYVHRGIVKNKRSTQKAIFLQEENTKSTQKAIFLQEENTKTTHDAKKSYCKQ